jgi:hypothetical protein
MLSINISAYKGDIPRNHVLVSCLYSAPIELGENRHLRQLYTHTSPCEGEKSGTEFDPIA